jgi:hypothetical protein
MPAAPDKLKCELQRGWHLYRGPVVDRQTGTDGLVLPFTRFQGKR